MPVKLYGHQNQAIDHLLRDDPELFRALVGPTACGKGTILMVATARSLRRHNNPVRGVLVVTPMEHIEDAFATAGEFCYRTENSQRSRHIHIATTFWRRLRDEKKIPDQLRELLKGRSKRGTLTTHAQIVRCHKQDVLPDDLTGWVLAIDEGHRSGEDKTALFAFMDDWYARGGTVWTLTATPFRADGRRIAPAHVQPLVFTYAELADLGILPRRITLRLLGLVSPGRPKGHLLDTDIDAVTKLIQREGRRDTAIRVQGGDSEAVSARIIEALKGCGYADDELLNAVGKDDKVKKHTMEVLLKERKLAKEQGYGATRLRAIVLCRRLLEGADWVTCSAAISIGLSTSLAQVIQFLGRAARSKQFIIGYPDEWRDEILFTILVPEYESGSTAEIEQAERLMQLSCALQCSDVVYDFHRFWISLVKNFRLPPQARISHAQLSHIGGISIEEKADARLMGVQAASTIRGIFGRVPLLGEVWELFKQWDVPNSFEALVALIEWAAAKDPDLKDAVETAGTLAFDEVKKRMKNGVKNAPELRNLYEEEMRKRLVELAEQYKHLSVEIDLTVARGLEGVLTPDRMRAIVKGMVAARDKVFDMTDQQIVETFIDPYKAHYGVMPSARRASARDLAKLTKSQQQESDYDRYLRRTGFSLGQLVVCRDWVMSLPLDLDELRSKLKTAHLSRLSSVQWDSPTSIVKAQYDGQLDLSRLFGRPENLVGIELSLQRGWRGCPGGQTLAEILG